MFRRFSFSRIWSSAQDHALLDLLLNLVGFLIFTWQNLSGGNDLYWRCTSFEKTFRRGRPLNILKAFRRGRPYDIIKAESYRCILKYVTYVYWNVFCKIRRDTFATYWNRKLKMNAQIDYTCILNNILQYVGDIFKYTYHMRNVVTTYSSITQVLKQYTASPRKIRVGIPTHSRHIQDYSCIYRCCSDIMQRPKKLFWACQHMHA